MSVSGCHFTGALLNNTSLHTYNNCTFVNADYTTKSTGYVAYYGTNTVKNVIRALAEYAGITDDLLVIEDLNIGILGYIITEQTTFRAVVEALQQAYFFDAYENEGVLNCVAKTQQNPPITIPEEDLGAVMYGDADIPKLKITDTDLYELPQQINLTFYNYSKNYQTGVVRARRRTYIQGLAESNVSVPVVMTRSEAQQIVDKLLIQTWTKKTTYDTQLSNKWSWVHPGCVIGSIVNGIRRIFQVSKHDYDGNLTKITCVNFVSPGVVDQPITEPTVELVEPGDICFYLMDMPLLTDTDGPGFYAAATAPENFKNVLLYKATTSDGNTLSYMDTLEQIAIAGTTLTVLGDSRSECWDTTNILTVSIINGTLASMPEIDVLNGFNAAYLGNEIIQFKTAKLVAANTYVLSDLLRGRKGTEWATGTHSVGERFIMLSTKTVQTETVSISDLDKAFTYKYGYAGMDETAMTFTVTGKGYKPYSPCHVKAVRDSNGNITATWIRRTRLSGGWNDYSDVILGEDSEQYSVDIYKNAAIVRTFTVATATFTYTAAQQISDFGTTQAAIHIIVYQVSALRGRGYGKDVTI